VNNSQSHQHKCCRNRGFLTHKKKEKSLENTTQKLGCDKACEKACEREQRREQGRYYELEWAILQVTGRIQEEKAYLNTLLKELLEETD
jgi:hypothetical protein